MMEKRHMRIIDLVSQYQKIEVNKLAELLDTSKVTIRKDLNVLAEKGILRRERGYALLQDRDDINYRMAFHYERKKRIARAAAELVGQCETVMIESGSCCMLLAEALAMSKKDVTIVTNSAYLAEYIREYRVKTVVLGGEYQPQVQAMVGPMTKLCARQYQVDKLFAGTDGFSPDSGFTGDNLIRSDTVKSMCESARNTVILTESEKFSHAGTVSFLKPEEVSCVITDQGISEETKNLLTAAGAKVICVEKGE